MEGMLTSRRRETGRHCLNSGSARKEVMNCGQVDTVKFEPMLESKAVGRAPTVCSAGEAVVVILTGAEVELGADVFEGVDSDSVSSDSFRGWGSA